MTRGEWEELACKRLWLNLLRDELRLASMPAEEQLAALPDQVDKPYELVADACNHLLGAVDDHNPLQLTSEQRQALVEFDELADAMSGPENAALWTEDAVRNHTNWEKLRGHAGQACRMLENHLDP